MGRPKGSKNKPPEEISILTVTLDNENQKLLNDVGAKQAVPSLAAHPGFRYLMAKLHTQRAFFRAKFEHQPPTSLQDALNLHFATFYSGWLERQVFDSVPALRTQFAESTPDGEVAELFKRAKANLVEVGVKER